MPKETLTLGIGLLLAGATLAHGNYTVRKGDTLVGIAHKLHVSGPALRIANGLGKKNTLRIGMTLTVPGQKHVAKKAAKAKKLVAHHGGDTYTVRPGDNDWTIASHVGLSRKALHHLNPNVAWTKIRPGMAIRLPSGAGAAANAPRLRSRYAVVLKPTVVRRAWSRESARVATLPPHTHATVLARQGTWYKVKSNGGSVGWVRGDLLRATSAPVAIHHEVARRAAVHHATVTYVAAMHRRPSRAQRIAHWQNHLANVRAKYVRRWSRTQRRYVVAPLPNGGDLIAKAETFKGVRYSWGAASRSGTDCSGFTTQVFRAEGVKLPRTSRQQATVGNQIDRGHLDKGDLIFFHTGRGHRITHVGIYMGGGKFIHASSGGRKVQVNNLTGYYANRFVTARRVPNKGVKKVAPKPVEPAAVAEETTGQ